MKTKRIFLFLYKSVAITRFFFWSILIFNVLSICAQEVHPGELEFHRQAVRRMIFDQSQNIPLAGLYPAKVVGLDVMYPAVGEQLNDPKVAIENSRLKISSQKPAKATRWIGGFNPFATYDVSIGKFTGSGEIGVVFRDTNAKNSITATLVVVDGINQSIHYVLTRDGQEVESNNFMLPKEFIDDKPICLRVQMLAVCINLFVERAERSTLIGQTDFVKYFDLRRKGEMQHFEFCLNARLEPGSSVEVDEISEYLSPGIGQSDIRVITCEDGTPLIKDERLWMCIAVRGGGSAHPSIQGIYSINPSVFDIRFEGIILYDRGDGLLRNDLASNLFYDRNQKEWRGFTTGFSAFGNPESEEKKAIWAVHSSKEPLHGISIMKAEPTGLIGDYEDPQCIYDYQVKKWRMLLCENHNGYKAVIREADKWNGPYKLIAGPVNVNSTGTQIQKFGQKRYALFGSADRKVYIYTYPDLLPVGELKILRPPWDDKTGTRIWPNVIPLPEGYPAPYIALMMDRLNFPGMKGSNWTYGAMYLYYGFPLDHDQ